MKFYLLDINRQPVPVDDMMIFAQFLADDASRRVAENTAGESRISTVFLGIDHRFGGKGPPVLFETMVFGGPMDGYQDRYVSWDDAETGHQMMVKKVIESYLGTDILANAVASWKGETP